MEKAVIIKIKCVYLFYISFAASLSEKSCLETSARNPSDTSEIHKCG